MSRTCRKNTGRNALQKWTDDYTRYLLVEDEEHTKIHGGYVCGKNLSGNFYEYYHIGYAARKFIALTGKERRKEKARLHKDGEFAQTVGKFFKISEWRKHRKHFRRELQRFSKDESYEVEYLPDPDSSWFAF